MFIINIPLVSYSLFKPGTFFSNNLAKSLDFNTFNAFSNFLALRKFNTFFNLLTFAVFNAFICNSNDCINALPHFV